MVIKIANCKPMKMPDSNLVIAPLHSPTSSITIVDAIVRELTEVIAPHVMLVVVPDAADVTILHIGHIGQAGEV